MHTHGDVILMVDSHLEHLEVRRLNCATGQEQRCNLITDRRSIARLVAAPLAEATPAGGKVKLPTDLSGFPQAIRCPNAACGNGGPEVDQVQMGKSHITIKELPKTS